MIVPGKSVRVNYRRLPVGLDASRRRCRYECYADARFPIDERASASVIH